MRDGERLAVATAASTALPPLARIAAPTSEAGADVLMGPSRFSTELAAARRLLRAQADGDPTARPIAMIGERDSSTSSLDFFGSCGAATGTDVGRSYRAAEPTPALDQHFPYTVLCSPRSVEARRRSMFLPS